MARIVIQDVIKTKGTNINQICTSMAMSRATAYRIARGKKSPCIEELEEFARVLGVCIEDLYESEYSEKHFSQY